MNHEFPHDCIFVWKDESSDLVHLFWESKNDRREDNLTWYKFSLITHEGKFDDNVSQNFDKIHDLMKNFKSSNFIISNRNCV